jgi:hypothetical protein
MNKPEYQLLPCIFCTIGYNGYVAGHKLVSKTVKSLTNNTKPAQLESREKMTIEQLNKQKITDYTNLIN